MLSHKSLCETLGYVPETGFFFWKKNRNARMVGCRAGCVAHNGYRRLRIQGKQYPEHRVAWFYVYGVWPSNVIDHINRNPIDNRITNLRNASLEMNRRNRGRYVKGGVTFTKGKWQAQFQFNGRKVYCGRYRTRKEALIALDGHHTAKLCGVASHG